MEIQLVKLFSCQGAGHRREDSRDWAVREHLVSLGEHLRLIRVVGAGTYTTRGNTALC